MTDNRIKETGLPQIKTKDLDFSGLFEKTGGKISLHSDIVQLGPEICDVLLSVMEKVRHVLANPDDQPAIDDLALDLRERFNLLLEKKKKERYFSETLGLNSDAISIFGIENEEDLRRISKTAIKTAIEIGLFTQISISERADVNRGQLSTYLNHDGPLSDEKICSLLNVIIREAGEKGSLDELVNKCK